MKGWSRKRISGLIAAVMMAETVLGGVTVVYGSYEQDILPKDHYEEPAAEILKESETAPDAGAPAAVTTEETAPGMDYVEGAVIVCVEESSDPASDDIERDGASYDLLSSAEELMDVSEAAEEVKQDEAAPSYGDEPASDKAGDRDNETRTVIKLIRSEEYSTRELIEMLSARDDVLCVEPNYVRRIGLGKPEDAVMADITEDPDEISEEGPADISRDGAWNWQDLTGKQYAYGNGPGGMDIPDWSLSENKNADGVVAVIDSGVDYNNPDLKDVMWDEGDEIPALVALGGGRYGYAPAGSAESGYDYDDPMDMGGHGTHCAGIIAAAWNGFGVSGAANGAKIMALRTVDYKGDMQDTAIVKCFNYVITAKKAGVNVVAVNNSWGGPFGLAIYRYVVRELGNLGIVVCFASGNDNVDIDLHSDTNTLFGGTANEISVGANDSMGDRSAFSNWGLRATDVFAPGTDILSTYPGYLGDIYGSLADTGKDRNGKDILDDYEATYPDTTYFRYEKTEYSDDPVISVNTIKDSDTGEKSLYISVVSGNTAESGRTTVLNIAGREEDQLPGGEYEVIIRHRSTNPNTVLRLYAKTGYEEYEKTGSGYSSNTWCETVFKLPADTDLHDLSLQLDVSCDNIPEYPFAICIDKIRLTEEREGTPYGLMSGTSMACPAATGAAAVIAKAFPDDSARKLAARILAGVKVNDALRDKCVTGGIVNVRNSLNESTYTPVIQEVRVDEAEGKLNAGGYFFGNDPSMIIKQSGEDEITLSSDKITKTDEPDGYCTLSISVSDIEGGLRSGELLVKVTNPSGQEGRRTGRRYVSIVRPYNVDQNYYLRLNRPEGPDLNRASITAMGAVNDRIVVTGVFEDLSTAVTWIFKIHDDGLELERCLSENNAISPAGNMYAWNKKLVFTDKTTSKFTIFDPAEGKVVDSALISGINMTNPAPVFFLTSDGTLLAFAKEYTKDGEPEKTSVYMVDTKYLDVRHLGYLDGDYTTDAIPGQDTDGQIYITGMLDGNRRIAHFRISDGKLAEGSVSVSDLNMPEGLSFNNEKMKGCSVRNGMIMINGCTLTGQDSTVSADNLYLDYEGCKASGTYSFGSGQGRIAPLRFVNGKCAAYKNRVYFLGTTLDEGLILSCMDAATVDTGDTEVPRPEGSVRITLTAANGGEVKTGKQIKITVATEPSLPANRIHWYSQDGTVASVDQKGIVTGIRPGITWIYAVADMPFEYKKACSVHVYDPATAIKLSNKNVKIAEGCKVDMTAYAAPLGGAAQDFTWVVKEPSSCKNLVKVGEEARQNAGDPRNLVIYAGMLPDGVKSARAKVTFKAVDGSKKTAVLNVTVYRATQSIGIRKGTKDVTGQEIPMTENKSMTLKADISPQKTTSKSLIWWSSDTSVATVKKGRVKATGRGSARIYAQATDGSEKKAYCTVSVNAPVRKAELNTSGTIYLGRDTSYDLSINRVTPVDCSTYTVEWKSSKPDIVSVSVNEADAGLAAVYASKAGTARVWAVITNEVPGGRKTVQTNKITVKVVQSSASANSVAILSGKKDITDNTDTVSNAAARVKAGKTLKLTAKAYDVQNRRLKKPYFVWTTNDPTIATVNNGKVKAYKEGAVTIGVHLVPRDGSTEWLSSYTTLYVYEPARNITVNYDGRKNVRRITLASTVSSDFAIELEADLTTKAKSKYDDIREEKEIIWTSSDENVLSFFVSDDGKAMFWPKKAGTVWVKARVNDGSKKTAKCKVKVIEGVRILTVRVKNLPGNASANITPDDEFSMDVHGLKAGNTFTIKPGISPSAAANKKLVYISSDPAAVTVDSKGRVRIKSGLEEDAYITVMSADGGAYAFCNLKKD